MTSLRREEYNCFLCLVKKICLRWVGDMGSGDCFVQEATMGFEPMIKVLQTSALPLGYVALIKNG